MSLILIVMIQNNYLRKETCKTKELAIYTSHYNDLLNIQYIFNSQEENFSLKQL